MTDTHRLTRTAYLQSLNDFREFIKAHCRGYPGVSDEVLYNIQLAVDEACTNIITHGYANMDPGPIILDLEMQHDKLTILLTDFGHSFEPGNTPAPKVDIPIEDRDLGGYGLFFIQHCMDQMQYQVTEEGNTMILTKYLSGAHGGT